MEAQKAIKADPRLQSVFDAVTALPDRDKALVADLMRALPDLTAADSQGRRWGRGDVAKRRLGEFIDDPTRVSELTGTMSLPYLTTDELARVGRAVFIPALDEEVSRARRFGPERRGG